MRREYLWGIIAVLGFIILITYLNQQYPDALSGREGKMDLVYSIGFLILVGSSVFASFRSNISQALKYAAAWIGIFLAIAVLYTLKEGSDNLSEDLVGNLMPSRAISSGNGEVSIRRSESGHFEVTAIVNGNPVRFMVDTGASDVSLSIEEAERVGIDTSRLVFNKRYQTANGLTTGARIYLDSVKIGDITLRNVKASVMRNGSGALLGLTFLDELSSYEVRRDKMILRQ